MFSGPKATEIYCMKDDFHKEFEKKKKNVWLKTGIINTRTSRTG